MPHVEKNMDDLFRKAAENYTPNPGDDNWEMIQPRLLNKHIDSAAAITKTKSSKNKMLLLLLFIAVGLAGYYSGINNKEKKTVTARNNASPKIYQKKENNFSEFKRSEINKAEKQPALKKKTINTNDVASLNSFKINTPDITKIVSHNYPGNKEESISLSNFNNNINTITTAEQKKDPPSIISEDKTNNTLPLLNSEPSASKNIIVKTNTKKFYVGIVAGAAFNEVKNQGFKKPGLSVGLLAGYSLNKNISLETGIQYKKKYYFSDAKYFDMAKTINSMPAGMKLMRLNGSSNVLEIPLSIKYNVKQTKTSAWFASAGISSYVLLKENNDYTGSLNGVQEKFKGLYNDVSTGFASSADISIGYEHKIGKQTSLRIQPYFQIPLKGIGVGKMQVMSSGINFAVTSPF